MTIHISKVNAADDLKKCFAIRMTVFVEGQNVPLAEEIDGKDEDSEHYLLLVDNQPAGVARVRFLESYAKIERVGILSEYQGQGLGRIIMEYILADLIKSKRTPLAKLSSQTYAIPFYEKLGFKVTSEEYMDAGIPHKDMLLNLY